MDAFTDYQRGQIILIKLDLDLQLNLLHNRQYSHTSTGYVNMGDRIINFYECLAASDMEE